MGSVENGAIPKRVPLLRFPLSSVGRGDRNPFQHKPRSWFARFLLVEKVDYLQWVCTVAIFFFVFMLFQAFLPGSAVEKSTETNRGTSLQVSEELRSLKEMSGLDFGEGIRFIPWKLLEKFRRELGEANRSAVSRKTKLRSELRRPQLALVFADLSPDAIQLQMTTIALSLQEIGYSIQVYSIEDGPAHSIWRKIGFYVNILQSSDNSVLAVDWLNYDAVLVNSLWARDAISCLLQEPFVSVPLIWTIHEQLLAHRMREYTSNGQVQLINDWKRLFSRASVVVFPDYVLPLMYSTFDAGNFFTIPGSPAEAWEVNKFLLSHDRPEKRIGLGYRSNDFVIAVIGSQFSYNGSWLEHSIILKALTPILDEFHPDSGSICLKVFIISGNSSSSYEVALKAIALKLGYPSGSVKHIGIDGDVISYLSVADLVIYGSFFEEQSFPPVLLQALCFGKPIIAPNLATIRKYIDDKVNGYLFPKENVTILTQVLFQAILKGRLSLLAQNIASIGKRHAKNLMVAENIEGYALLLESILKLPSEVAKPKATADIPLPVKEEWKWNLFKEMLDFKYQNITFKRDFILDKVEEKWKPTANDGSTDVSRTMNESLLITDWDEIKAIEMENMRRRREEEELKDRTDQPHGTWEEVYRNAKRANRNRNELHERDDRELERTGQPLCIYEPYFGEGAWPFLHTISLYRGISVSTKGRRPGYDDIDAPSRLQLLNDPYYRDVLGEYGAFFAVANRIDRIHKNAWIGFQSWRAAARKDSLSKVAESMLLEVIQSRRHGDTLYFWVRMDKDSRNPLKHDFWSFCDAINAGNCRFAVSQALHKVYGVEQNSDLLPPMPVDGDTWSVMHSWALPSRSFLEFMIFARMFVDALDAEMYDEHHDSGHCYLSLSKDRHCYSRVLELLVNVWAYHSARRMIYINPVTGSMEEHHKLKRRKGHMWIKWFSFTTLKSMDEELAEEWDSDPPDRRSLWPLTGEVFWQGVYERERRLRNRQKERKKQQSKDKISRIRKRTHQKTLGKYVKPPPEMMGTSTNTLTTL